MKFEPYLNQDYSRVMKKHLLPLTLILTCLFVSSSSYAFTLRDVERKCEVWRWSENWGEVDCRGSDLRIVERKCEVWFPNSDDEYGYIECSGSDLRAIESCSVSMWSESYGDIDC